MIRRLPESLINKIAAGEVVERPASAVKELVENALDAGAGGVVVDLRDGGSALIRVSDDGRGMTADELPVALERHATSKLSRDEDLAAIATLGFRGEALPAICGVSRFTITSRARGAADGLRLSGAGGLIAQRLTLPAERGTTVEVQDLFFNTPARLKFLKSPAAETAATLRALTALAAAHPDVQLRVTHNGRAAITAPAAADGRARMGALWGWEVAERLLVVDRTEHGIHVAGLVGPPDLTRGNRDDLLVVVNGRPVRDPALAQAVLEAYRPLLPRDRYPLAVVRLAVDPAEVDVNVHPTKATVRFRHARLVHEMILASLREALRHREVVPALHRGPAAAGDEAIPLGVDIAAAGGASDGAQQGALFAEAPAPYGSGLFGRVLGQVQDTFIVAASDREVFFLDQHVAHERVLFERLQAELRAGPLASQHLLFPEPLEISPATRALLGRWREPMERMGFAFAEGGERVILVAVPTSLRGQDPLRLIEAAVDDLGSSRAGGPAVDRALAFVACRAAVKADTALVREEMERMVSDLGSTATPYFCPHGRPIVSRLSLADIRKELAPDVVASAAPLVVIAGPTGVGKTATAVALAARLPIEVISADSRQVYRGMDIATGKPTPGERAAVRHHLIDVADPDDRYNAARFRAEALRAVGDARTRGRIPVVVGGTGLYIRALLRGLDPAPPADPSLRAELTALAAREGREALHRLLRAEAPSLAARLHPNDWVRVIRALELARADRTDQRAWEEPASLGPRVHIGLTSDRECLAARLRARCQAMVAGGLVAEVEQLLARGYDQSLPALHGIGYRDFASVVRGKTSVEAALRTMQRDTVRYAKRQMTWFRREPDIEWIDIGREGGPDRVAALVEARVQYMGASGGSDD